MKSIRYQHIDRLKGFAMISVVMYHTILGSLNDNWHYAENDPLSFLFYSYQMPLFMFLSGLMVTEARNGYKALQKFMLFMVPCISFGILKTFVYHSGILDFLSQDVKGGYWYLWVLAFFYVFLWASEVCLERIPTSWIKDIITAAAIYLMMRLMSTISPYLVSGILGLNSMISMWPFFMLGYLVRKYNWLHKIYEMPIVYSLAILSIAPLYLIFSSKTFIHFIQLLNIAFIIVLMVLFHAREKKESVFEKMLGNIGRNSLDVYILHYFFLSAINLPLLGPWFCNTHNYFLELVLLILLAIPVAGCCIIIGRILRKSDFIQVIFYGNISRYL